MNRRLFFGILALPFAPTVVPAKPADWAVGQTPDAVNASARAMLAKSAQWLKPEDGRDQ